MSKKILLVDDDADLQSAYQQRLTQEGYSVIAAVNGEEGLQQAHKHSPDLIVLDIQMPVMDGLTMLSRLRNEAWGKKVPVIILTNSDRSEDVLESLKDQAQSYFIKTQTTLEVIVSAINDVMGSEHKLLVK